jgi:hypothetical protein
MPLAHLKALEQIPGMGEEKNLAEVLMAPAEVLVISDLFKDVSINRIHIDMLYDPGVRQHLDTIRSRALSFDQYNAQNPAVPIPALDEFRDFLARYTRTLLRKEFLRRRLIGVVTKHLLEH